MRPHTLIHTKLYVHESDDSLRKQETWSQCSLILAELEEMDEEKVGVKGPCNLRRRKRSKNRGKENRRLTPKPNSTGGSAPYLLARSGIFPSEAE